MTAATTLRPGTVMPQRRHTVEQADLIRYAGASGDFNRLHWDEPYAAQAGPAGGVIVHGMLTLGLLVRVVGEWVGGDDRVLSTSVSFRAPCPVGATVTLRAEVLEDDGSGAPGTAVLAVGAELPDGSPVLDAKRSRIVVRTG
ncbi:MULTISPECIES: MaoC family dehydratase [Pseudonocardia]|uniref:MaoC family dehydratase n=2 Tax=Pseudonocardia TaxID=1847 RepID=A0ABQ0S699_9PSEU|nr:MULTISPECIES: MaoC family dehydratase [Pseudonocardia]OSY40067.1 putative enoyl-CoA hydratase 1 [Pseudonocardia autotrophica]TDN72987.1 acyl dehydratase [Pseudonocardia autotrophica]BBG03707.1 MaoC family dehydratase [Pseudonocardia autotrophica]GEC28396.1 MaoC family dehydratase [Pseudonocardia saturnea]